MTILVTGSAGHFGEAVLRTLCWRSSHVRGIDLKASPFTDAIGSTIDPVWRKMDGVTAVILHAAACIIASGSKAVTICGAGAVWDQGKLSTKSCQLAPRLVVVDFACSQAQQNLIIFFSTGVHADPMELSFPIEFIIYGTAVSLQAKRAESKNEWKERVKVASTAVIPQPHFASQEPIGVTLYYLPDEPMTGDIDNIVKPILDALSAHIYVDDQQVERLVVQKFEPGIPFKVENPTETVAAAVSGPRPALYVRLSNKPREELR